MIPEGAKVHHVTPGETLFSIAKSYNISMDQLMASNGLKGTDLSVGQALIIEGVKEKVTPEKEQPVTQKQQPVAPQKVEETAEIVDQTVAVTTEKPAPKKKQIKKKQRSLLLQKLKLRQPLLLPLPSLLQAIGFHIK